MLYFTRNIGAVLFSLSVIGCADELPSNGQTNEQNPDQTAQMIVAARAVTEDVPNEVPMDVIMVWGPSGEPDERQGVIREALGVAEPTCEIRACVQSDLAVVRLNFLQIVQEGEDQARITVDRLVPTIDGGNVEWKGKMYDVRLQRDRGGWTVTAARLILE